MSLFRSEEYRISLSNIELYAREFVLAFSKSPASVYPWWAEIKSVWVIGSQIRKDKPPRRCSDLDLIVILDTDIDMKDKRFHAFEKWTEAVEKKMRSEYGVKINTFLDYRPELVFDGLPKDAKLVWSRE